MQSLRLREGESKHKVHSKTRAERQNRPGRGFFSGLTSDHWREGVLAGHGGGLAEAGRVQGVLGDQLPFLSFTGARGG